MAPPVLTQFFAYSDRQKIQSVLADSLIAAYGIVQAVSGKLVDVELAVQSVSLDGTVIDPMLIRGVEVLFPSSSGMGQSWTIRKGDGVLIVGLQSLIPSTDGLSAPAAPEEYWNYAAQTAKAIPLSGWDKAAVKFGESGGKAFLRNASASLYTVLNNLASALQTFANTTSSATTAPQIAAAAATLVPAMVNVTTALGALLEA